MCRICAGYALSKQKQSKESKDESFLLGKKCKRTADGNTSHIESASLALLAPCDDAHMSSLQK